MGNNISVPPREPFVNQQASYNKMLQNVNQSKLVGNPDPVTQNNDANAILKAASPRGFNLTQATKADRSEMKGRADQCRTYGGMAGLRTLKLDTGVRTAYEPGCGWIYKNNGINRGAFGSEGDPSSANNTRAPIFSLAGELDEVKDGASFSMDLDKIERIISEDMVNGITTCQGMAAKVSVSDVGPYIGFCQTSGRVIPVIRSSTGTTATARFTDDVHYRCASDKIILPDNISNCPAPGTENQTSNSIGNQGFKNYESVQTRGRNIDKAFYQPNWALNNQRAAMPQMLSNRGGFAAGAERQRQGTNFGGSRSEGFTAGAERQGRDTNFGGSRSEGFTAGGSQQFSPSSFARHEGFATGDSPLLSPRFGNRRSEGFTAGGSQQFSPNGGFARHEGFAISTPFEDCIKLGNLANNNGSKECIIMAARQAGFVDNGAFLKFISAGLNSTIPPVFENYNRLKMNTAFDPSTFTNGTKSIYDIINILTNVRLDINSSDNEISKAATDIVSDAGLYENNYNLCSWIEKPEVDENLINSTDTTTEKCLQNYWRNRGGDSRGIQFPTLATWGGQRIGLFKQAFQLIASDINSTNMDTQSTAIKNQYGVTTYKEKEIVNYIEEPRNCERDLISSTKSSCPVNIGMEETMPKYTDTYREVAAAVAPGVCVLEEQKDCTSTRCNPVNCLGVWQESACSTQCGAGTKTKTYAITRAASCGGQECEIQAGTTQSNISCSARECQANDCVYTHQVTTECPIYPGSPENCGKTFNRITNIIHPTNYSSDILSKCPTSPLIESCGPIIPCAPIIDVPNIPLPEQCGTPTIIGTFVLSGRSNINDGNSIYLDKSFISSWNDLGVISYITLPNLVVQTLTEKGLQLGIPKDGKGTTNAQETIADCIVASDDRTWGANYGTCRGIPPTPYIISKPTSGGDKRMKIYVGQTFCIILKCVNDPNSQITFGRIGIPDDRKRIISYTRNYQDGPWVRNWVPRNNGLMWPMLDKTYEVFSGTPIIGAEYTVSYSIRGSDVDAAKVRGYTVIE